MHSVSGLVHLFLWNSRHTSSWSHLESLPLRRLFMLTMLAMPGAGGGCGGGSTGAAMVAIVTVGREYSGDEKTCGWLWPCGGCPRAGDWHSLDSEGTGAPAPLSGIPGIYRFGNPHEFEVEIMIPAEARPARPNATSIPRKD